MSDAMTEELDLSVIAAASRCGDHPIDVLPEQVASVLWSRQWCNCEVGSKLSCNSICDTYGVAVYLLTDGRFAVVEESSDTSGHGCQCGASASVWGTMDDALRLGLTENDAAMIGCASERAAALART